MDDSGKCSSSRVAHVCPASPARPRALLLPELLFVDLLQELHVGHFVGQVLSAADLDQHLSGVRQGRLLRIVLVEASSLASISV